MQSLKQQVRELILLQGKTTGERAQAIIDAVLFRAAMVAEDEAKGSEAADLGPFSYGAAEAAKRISVAITAIGDEP